jgi:hypothetical protein
MNLEAAIVYAQQRMREIGKKPCEYHFEPVTVFPSDADNQAGYFNVNAYNELYILLNAENYAGIFIIADNSSYNSNISTQCGVPEFTGKITFRKIAVQWTFSIPNNNKIFSGIEFLRVVY